MKNQKILQYYPVAMTIAGSDSGGGAGIQADLRTFNALGVFGTTAITAVTSQNPQGVSRIDAIPADGVRSQIEAVLKAIKVRWCKSGMLFSSETVEMVADAIKTHALKLVCDPVMVSTSGVSLLKPDAVEAVRRFLLPVAQWITPNLPEAELLLERKISGVSAMKEAALALHEQFGCAVWVKGGHAADKAQATDVICKAGKLYTITSPVLDVPKFASHGTGCTLSSALAATLSLDMSWKQAVCESKAFVFGSLRENVEIGRGTFAMYPPTEDSIGCVRLEECGENKR